jgi:hypothetical protein
MKSLWKRLTKCQSFLRPGYPLRRIPGTAKFATTPEGVAETSLLCTEIFLLVTEPDPEGHIR